MLAPAGPLGDHPSVSFLTDIFFGLIALFYLLAMTTLVGTAAFHFLIWRRTSLPWGPVRAAAEEQVSKLVISCGLWSSAALLLLAGPRALGVASLLDDRYTLSRRMATLVLRSGWGLGLGAILLAAAISFLGYRGVGKQRAWGWPLVLLGIVLVALGAGVQGHPQDVFSELTLAPLFDGLHTVSTGAWLGAFFLLVLAERRLPAHTASPWTDPLGAMIERYFSASGSLAALVVITGLFSATTHLAGLNDLGGTPYGRVLRGKVVIFVILMVINEFHRRHAERKARTSERPQLVHSLRFQAGLICVILALTAVLLDTSPPGANEVRSEVFRTVPTKSTQGNTVKP